MDKRQVSAKVVFDEAVSIESYSRRAAYLAEACAGDDRLRDKVEDLLKAHKEAGSFLDSPPPGLDITIDAEISEGPGTIIGPYKLLQQIGEGGMGMVYMAEQTQPVERRVALKIIKPGMDSKQVIARFEAERQALAMMDHPNIAKVLDAGTTESGRPYFVMELVKGIPITTFCDEQNLTPRERMGLFVPVCQAIQHAHQKGIIHRDIKPSNVLVAEYDDQPVPRIIDFGVAKATSQKLTEKTMFTQFGQIVGTLEYMSPEQAKFNQLDINTRSDIYSLGVLLYELLTGATPFDKERLRSAALDEVMRIIREEEPPKPSTKISTLGETARSVSARRNTDPKRLCQLVRGDLDWMVMKALEKDRGRRYQTVSGLADDIHRFLNDEAIEARPPSASYRLRKFVWRYRGPVVSVGLIMLALLFGLTGTLSGWLRAVERQAELEQALTRQTRLVDEYRKELTEKALICAMAGNIEATRETANRLIEVEDSEGQVLMIRGLANFYGGDMTEARSLLERAVEAEPNNVAALAVLGIVEGYEGDFVVADQHRIEALNMPPREDYRDYDELFLAFLMMYYKPSEAVARLENIVQRRPSPLVHIQLAGAIAEEASYLMEPADAVRARHDMRKAAEHVQIARDSAPENYFVTLVDFVVHCVDLRLAKIAGDAEWDDLKLETDLLANELEATRTSVVGLSVVAWYYEIVEEPDNVERVLQALAESGGSTLWSECRDFATDSHRADSSRLTDADLPAFGRITDAFLAVDDPTERAFVEDNWDTALFPELRDSRFSVFVLQLPLLLGKESRCRTRSEELLKEGIPTYIREGIETRFNEPMLKHLAGRLDDGQLLARARDLHEVYRAHFQIGLKQLTNGDRTSARESFEKAASVCATWLPESLLARAFSERMIREPSWPDWLEGNEAE